MSEGVGCGAAARCGRVGGPTVLLHTLDVQAGRRLAAGPSQGARADLAALRVPPSAAAAQRVPPLRGQDNEVIEA